MNKKDNSFGKAFFQENIYAKFYDKYFREIPKEFLVSLGDLRVPFGDYPSKAKKIDTFNKPTLVVIARENILDSSKQKLSDLEKIKISTIDGDVSPKVVPVNAQTIIDVGGLVFTKDKDAFQALIQSCNRYLYDKKEFLENFLKKKTITDRALSYAWDCFWQKGLLEKFGVPKNDLYAELEVALAFLLSFYSVFTTDFKRLENKYKNELIGLYLDPIVASYTNNKKRGVFFVGFSFKRQSLRGKNSKLAKLIGNLHQLFGEEARRLYGIDSRVALEAADGQSRIFLEEMLIRCRIISDAHKKDTNVNRARDIILKNLRANPSKELRGSNDIGIVDLDPIKTITGASEKYCSFLKLLLGTARTNFDQSQNEFRSGQCFFLYSPPGCGKETLAKLIHLAARSYICVKSDDSESKPFVNETYYKTFLKGWQDNVRFSNCLDYPVNKKRLDALRYSCPHYMEQPEEDSSDEVKEAYNKNKKRWKAAIRAPFILEMAHPDFSFDDKDIKDNLDIQLGGKNKWLENWWREFFDISYFSMNCALLTERNMERLLFGCKEEERLVGLRQIGFIIGTAFLDEVNTLPKGVENRFLRLLEKPYEAIFHLKQDSIVPTEKISGLNVLYVFASNKRPEELIEAGFNSAFIGRIRQHYFEIPTLRERPADIALAFSTLLHAKKDESPEVKWERISHEGLRFVCMLPWVDNLRGLKGFVEALALERLMRGIEAEEISFEEIVECAVNRNLITTG